MDGMSCYGLGCPIYKHKPRRWMACPVMDWDVLFTNINHVDGWHVLLWIGMSYLQT